MCEEPVPRYCDITSFPYLIATEAMRFMPLSLGLFDLTVLFVSLALVIVIGRRASGKTKDLEAYLLGDRNLPWWAILGSIVATETSTATVLSVPGHGYGPVGMRYLQLAMGFVLGRFVVVRVFLPLYFSGKLFTAYEVLGARFGTRAKLAASLLFLVTRNLGDGLRLFLAAMVLQQLAGWPFLLSLIVMGVITMVYTYFGGMRSVVWNDCLQFVIYMLGAFAALFVIAHHVNGGWDAVWSYAEAHDKFTLFDFQWSWTNPYTFWAGLLGGAALTIGTHGTDHMMVQRYLSARSQREAGRAVLLSSFVVFIQFAIFLFIGIELGAYYAQHPEVEFAKPDQVFAHFIVNVFPKNIGLVGLMLSAILAAAMSTLSSSLNSSASALVNDFYLPRRKDTVSPEQALAITRRWTLGFGCLQMAIGYWATQLNSTVVDNALTIAGFSAGLLLGVYTLGVATRSVRESHALFGAGVGLVALLFLQFGTQALGWSRLAFPWLALVGTLVTASSGLLASWVSDRVFPKESTP